MTMPDDTPAAEPTVEFDADSILNMDAGEVAELAELALGDQKGSGVHQRAGTVMLAVAIISMVRIADALEALNERKG
jgi:hypothetical protein